MNEYVSTATEAKKYIGQTLYWDDASNRYVFLRSGILEEVTGKNLRIDGDYKYIKDLPGLRNFPEGGKFAQAVKR